MRTIKKGATSQSVYVEILDSTSTTGGRKTGLAFNTASLTGYYVRNQGSATAITLATLAAANSAWSSGGFKEVDATNMPGVYRLDVPDASVAAGSGDDVTFTLKGATGMAQVSIGVQLLAWDPQDTVRGGLTALPNAAAEAAGGLYTRGSGAGQIAQQANGQVDVNLSTIKTQAVTCAAGVTVLASVGTAATSTAQTGDNFARIGANGTGLTGVTGATLSVAYDAAKTASQAGDAMALTSGERNSTADALLDRANAIETAWTVRKAMRVMFAALGGKASGMGTATGVFRAGDDSKDRITATIDASGNRTAVTLDGT